MDSTYPYPQYEDLENRKAHSTTMQEDPTSYQIREFREDENYRYREKQLLDGMDRKHAEMKQQEEERRASRSNKIDTPEAEMYAKIGSREIEKTKTEQLMGIIFLILLITFGMYIIRFL